MRNIEEQLNELQKTTMRSDEKQVIRTAVVSYMKENPLVVRKSSDGRLLYRTRDNVNKLKTKTNMTIALIIALLLSGGTSFAAESAMPGDSLYPIKIHVNERVQEITAISDEAGARVQAKLAERRLEEAENLAIRGGLDAKASADLEARFEHRSGESMRYARLIKEKRAAESASSDLEVMLLSHQELLTEAKGNAKAKAEIGALLESVAKRLKEASDIRISAEAESFLGDSGVEAKIRAEGAMKASENHVREIKEYLAAKKEKISSETQIEIDARLKAADNAILQGKAKINTAEFEEAFAFFKKAAREAQQAKTYANMRQNLNFELNRGGVGDISLKIDEKISVGQDPKTGDGQEKNTGCYVSGCSGQICSDRNDVVSTCEMKPEYQCYKDAVCERRSDGKCGWTETALLKQCLSLKADVELNLETNNIKTEADGVTGVRLGL